MKKTQVALAALALVASTAALANGVTVYGNLEGGVARTSGQSSYFSSAGGFTAGTYIGFKGTEEIGGLKASFNLESGVDLNGHGNNGGGATACAALDPTACNGNLFSRVATVGLAGEMGSLTIGRQISPMVSAYAGTATLGNGHFFVNYIANAGGAAVNSNATSNQSYEGFFIPNAISYSSPTVSGFTFSALGQMKTGNNRGIVNDPIDTDSYQAYSLTGAVGSVNVAAAYDTRKSTYSSTMLGASTKFGDLTIAGSYYNNKPTGADSVTSMSIEAGYGLTEALNVGLQYGKIDSAAEKTLTGVFAKYALSKRTLAYATFITAKNVSSSYDTRGEAYTGNNNTTAVGIAHSF
jgi:predicted porin